MNPIYMLLLKYGDQWRTEVHVQYPGYGILYGLGFLPTRYGHSTDTVDGGTRYRTDYTTVHVHCTQYSKVA